MKKILVALAFISLLFLQCLCDSDDDNTPSTSTIGTTTTTMSGFTVHYYNSSGWSKVYIHYNAGGSWTTSPGEEMTSEGNNWFYKLVPTNTTECVFNDGGSTWDNNNSKNYTLSGVESWIMGGSVFTNNPTSNTYTITIHYKPASYFTSPSIWIWRSGGSGVEISASSNDSFGKVYTITTNGGFVYGFKFREGNTWEPTGIERYLPSLTTNLEYYVVGESKALFTSDPSSIIADPTNSSITNSLGANIQSDGSTVNFVLFAPSSKSVSVAGEFNSWDTNANRMKLTSDGKLWWTQISITSPNKKQYKYVLDGSTWVCDPYARANSYSSGNSIIIDTNFSWRDSGYNTPDIKEIVIYELHIKDMTSGDTNISASLRGKFLGLTNKINYLKTLGINCIEIMPMAEFPGSGYSWGYNTSLYFAPETDYGTTNDGSVVNEFKAMINEFHKNGIAVILDVVYNHTANSDNWLWSIDGDYYFDPAGTDWGNKFDITTPMGKRLMYDNMKYWMEEYHIDGFRLDGVYVMDTGVVKDVISQLKTDGYTNKIYIAEIFGNSDFKGTGIATWSSTYRDFAKWLLKNSPDSVGGTKGVASMVWYCKDWGYFDSPAEAVNYLESHDEETMGHYLGTSAFKQAKFGISLLATSLGVPMIYEGQELNRSKGEQDTSEENNRIDWNLLSSNTNFYNYAAGILTIRTTYPAFYADESTLNWKMVGDSDWNSKMLVFTRETTNTNDAKFLVCLNFDLANDITRTISNIDDGTWKLIADMNEVNTNGITNITVSGSNVSLTIPAGSCYIYMK